MMIFTKINLTIFANKFNICIGLKKIDKFIATSFIGPAILSYFIATFVLIMQFLWKYIDEILGKGLSILEMMELIFYYAATLIPMAVPIAVLISSVMVFGDMAEKYELSSMKSAGISLLRIMWSGILIAVGIGIISILSANFLKPASLLQFNKRFIAIKKQKSALAIEQGIFNDAFTETIIRVNHIDDNKRDIHDVLIYDHTPNDKSLIRVTSAKSGKMFTAQEGRYFVMELDTGISYQEEEKRQKLGSNKTERPFTRMYFDKWSKTFDMSVFDGEDGLLNFNRDREQMMNSVQLINAIDSFKMNINSNNEKVSNKMALLFTSNQDQASDDESVINKSYREKYNSKPTQSLPDSISATFTSSRQLEINRDSQILALSNKTDAQNLKKTPIKTPERKLIKQKTDIKWEKGKHWVETIDSVDFNDVISKAISNLSSNKDQLLSAYNNNTDYDKQYQKYQLRLHQQYSWAAICVIFLFIGAPLGSIIRKGGYGYPLLVAILFYMVFIISTIYGEKMVRSDAISGIQAAWMPCLILAPWSILFTIMAIRDTSFNPTALLEPIYKLWKKKKIEQ